MDQINNKQTGEIGRKKVAMFHAKHQLYNLLSFTYYFNVKEYNIRIRFKYQYSPTTSVIELTRPDIIPTPTYSEYILFETICNMSSNSRTRTEHSNSSKFQLHNVIIILTLLVMAAESVVGFV